MIFYVHAFLLATILTLSLHVLYQQNMLNTRKHLGIFNCGHRLLADDSISLNRRRFDTILENVKRVCVCSLHVLYQQNMLNTHVYINPRIQVLNLQVCG